MGIAAAVVIVRAWRQATARFRKEWIELASALGLRRSGSVIEGTIDGHAVTLVWAQREIAVEVHGAPRGIEMRRETRLEKAGYADDAMPGPVNAWSRSNDIVIGDRELDRAVDMRTEDFDRVHALMGARERALTQRVIGELGATLSTEGMLRVRLSSEGIAHAVRDCVALCGALAARDLQDRCA